MIHQIIPIFIGRNLNVMGLPVSKFHILADICSKESFIQNEFSAYKLVCIVLHDPDDEAFNREMRRRFAKLHEWTGKDMLFITFIDPPSRWHASWGGEDGFYKRNVNVERGLDSWLVINNFLPVVAPESNLPCILVTHDLLSQEYVILEISIYDFERQLVRLGDYCSSSPERFSVSDPRFQDFVSGLGNSQYRTLPERSVAEELAGTLALSKAHNYDREAVRWAKRRLSELKERVVAAGEDDYRAASLYNSYVTDLESNRGIERRSGSNFRQDYGARDARRSGYYLFPEKIKGLSSCDILSRGNIHQFNELLPSYISDLYQDDFGMHRLSGTDDDISYGLSFKQLALPLTEFFERELNMTLVQQMRMHLGIEMPEYYRKFKKDFFAIVKLDKGTVALNACEYPDRLKPVMTGQAFMAYRAICEENGPYRMKDRMGPRFIEEWYTLAKLRNKVSHAEYELRDRFGLYDFMLYFKDFSSVLRRSLWKMEALAEALKKGEDLPVFAEDSLFEQERGSLFPNYDGEDNLL